MPGPTRIVARKSPMNGNQLNSAFVIEQQVLFSFVSEMRNYIFVRSVPTSMC